MRPLLSALLVVLLIIPLGKASAATFRYVETRPAQSVSGDPIHISGTILINDDYLQSGIDIDSSDTLYVGLTPSGFSRYGGVDYVSMTFEYPVETVGVLLRLFVVSCEPINELCAYNGLVTGDVVFGDPSAHGLWPMQSFGLSFSNREMLGAMSFASGLVRTEVGYIGSSSLVIGNKAFWTTNWLSSTGLCSPEGDVPPCFGGAGLWLQVPEPATLALLGLAIAGLGFARRRKLH